MHHLAEEYKSCKEIYDGYKIKIEELVKELLIQNSISLHKIESRTKDPIKLDEKIARKNDKYNTLDDITDLVGIRIVTYFDDDVDKAAEIVSNEFDVDLNNSVDKRKLDIDRFGYKSLHYVVSLKADRQNLTEYKRFGEKKIEIQIRSILQHAWAEIEHDLGYKGKLSIPDTVKRNFYRVAALLETADIEFLKIKEQLKDYERNVADTIKHNPEDVEINAASLRSYYNNSKTLKDIDDIIVKDNELIYVDIWDTHISDTIERLYFSNIKTIKELDNSLIENRNQIIKFAKNWFGDYRKGVNVCRGISIFYLSYVLVGKAGDLKHADKYAINILNISEADFGSKIINTYNEILTK